MPFTALDVACALGALVSFSFGIFFFELPFAGFKAPLVAVDFAPFEFEVSSVSVTSVILGVLLSEDCWNLVVLMLGRIGGLGVELDGRAFGFGGSFGMPLPPFHEGMALGGPLLNVTLSQSQL